MERSDRRSFFKISWQRGLELASTLPLVGLMFDNYQQKRAYYVADFSGVQSSLSQNARAFCDMGADFTNYLQRLYNEYDRAYHIAHTRTYSTTDGKGNVSLHTETYYVWEEPNNVPDHTQIEEWMEKNHHLCDRIKHMTSQKFIDSDKVLDVAIKRNEASRGIQALLSTGAYGLAVAGLLGYEEVAAHLNINDYYGNKTLKEKVEQMDTPSQISRRSFIKILAAGAGAAAALKINSHNRNIGEEGKENLQHKLEDSAVATQCANADKFSRYFGLVPQEIILNAKIASDVSSLTLQNGVRDKGVVIAFQNLSSAGQVYVNNLERYFANGVPDELAKAATDCHVTKLVMSESGKQRYIGNLGVLLEGAALIGAAAAVIIPSEIINERYE